MKQKARYFRQVRRHIPIGGMHKKEFLTNIEKAIEVYAAENPEAALSDFYKRFGTPDEIAGAFLSEMSYGEINNRMQRWRRAFVMVICIALVAVVALFVAIAHMLVENRSSHNGYFVDSEPEIITNINQED